MNPTTPPPEASSTPSASSSRVRLALLTALLLATCSYSLLSKMGKANSTDKTNRPTVNAWLEEVRTGWQATPCPHPDSAVARARLEELPTAASRWVETAQLDPSENLRALVRIRGLANCSTELSPRLDQVIELTIDKLATRLDKALRVNFASLRHSEDKSDRKAQHKAAVSLLHLLEAHEGPLKDYLAGLERQLRD